jgi:uncharacterized repeat protein (TIGR02059 family)
MSEDLKAMFRRMRKKDLMYSGNLGGSAQGGSGGGGGNSPAVADTTAPELSSAVVPSAGTTLGLTYNENLLASGDGIPDIADYSISSGGTAVTISAVSVSGAIVTLNLARTITSGETLSFNYTAGASGRVQDAANNIASNLSSQAVTNNAADVQAPSLSGATDTKTGSSTADLKVVSDETNGTTYYVVTKSATPPTAAQVKSGLDDVGSAAISTGSISASTTLSWGVTSLSASTTFYAHFMQEDVATNQSTVASGDGFTTDAAGGDPSFASVVLLAANDNAAHGTTTFDDQSNANKTITPAGPPSYTNVGPPTGMTTTVISTANTRYIRVASDADMGMSTGDFTIECYYYLDANSANQVMFDMSGGALVFQTNGSSLLSMTAAGTTRTVSPVSAGTWFHFAYSRASSVGKCFLDGTQFGTNVTDSTNYAADTCTMMNWRFNNAGAPGKMASFRVTKGVGRYTGNFTPPTLPLPSS